MATPYVTTNLEAGLHETITKEAKKNKISMSEQIRRYKDLADVMKHGVN